MTTMTMTKTTAVELVAVLLLLTTVPLHKMEVVHHMAGKTMVRMMVFLIVMAETLILLLLLV